jgi:hypothetical protein
MSLKNSSFAIIFSKISGISLILRSLLEMNSIDNN